MLRSIPVMDRTRRVAKFYEGRTVNLGRWWRWLANVQDGIKFCHWFRRPALSRVLTLWRQRFVVSQDDGHSVNFWPMGMLKVTTCWSEAQPRQPRQPAIPSRGVPQGTVFSRAGKRAPGPALAQ